MGVKLSRQSSLVAGALFVLGMGAIVPAPGRTPQPRSRRAPTRSRLCELYPHERSNFDRDLHHDRREYGHDQLRG